MKQRMGFLLLLCLVVSCGKGTENTSSAPAATADPEPASTPITSTPPPTDSRLPEWVARAVPVQIVEAGNYKALESFFGTLYLPLANDPLVAMSLTGDRSHTVSGKLNLAIEDAKGFSYAEIPAVTDAGYRDSTYIDAIFADDLAVARVTGTISTQSKLNATVSFRVRQSGEGACQPWVVCDYSTGTFGCKQVVDVTECRNYVDTTHATVLGTFQADYLNWLVTPTK